MKFPFPRLTFICLTVMAASTFSLAQSSYSVTDLGSLSSNGYTVANGVNATGQVTGASGSTRTNTSDVILYSDGTLTNLGTLGGTSGLGLGINRLGQVAGIAKFHGAYRGFFTSGGDSGGHRRSGWWVGGRLRDQRQGTSSGFRGHHQRRQPSISVYK